MARKRPPDPHDDGPVASRLRLRKPPPVAEGGNAPRNVGDGAQLVKNPTRPQEIPLLNKVPHDALAHIVNKLDFSELLRFAGTCKPIKEFVFNKRGISVNFQQRSPLRKVNFVATYVQINFEYHLSIQENKFTIRRRINGSRYHKPDRIYTNEEVEKLQLLPIWIHFSTMSISLIDPATTEATTNFLRKFSRVTIGELSVGGGRSNDWSTFLRFLQVNRIRKVNLYGVVDIPMEMTLQLLQGLESFGNNTIELDKTVLLQTRIKTLNFAATRVDARTFKALVERFLEGEIVHWNMRAMGNMEDFQKRCLEINGEVKYAKMKEINNRTIDRGVWYKNAEFKGIFFGLMANDKIGMISLPKRIRGVDYDWFYLKSRDAPNRS